MSIEKIKENVYAITDGSTRGNVAAYVLPNQIVFVDSGMNLPLMKRFRDHIEKETGKKASHLFITHAHGDHVFGNQIFEDCEIITSKHTNELMIESKDNFVCFVCSRIPTSYLRHAIGNLLEDLFPDITENDISALVEKYLAFKPIISKPME